MRTRWIGGRPFGVWAERPAGRSTGGAIDGRRRRPYAVAASALAPTLAPTLCASCSDPLHAHSIAQKEVHALAAVGPGLMGWSTRSDDAAST